MPEANTLLVAGASGNLGRLVIEALIRSGAPRLLLISTQDVGPQLDQHVTAFDAYV